jgi:hypothetical protein
MWYDHTIGLISLHVMLASIDTVDAKLGQNVPVARAVVP